MGGFYPHTGMITQGYTTLPCTTFDTALTDIVTDLGSGVNGWTLYDDQRGVIGSNLWAWCGGFNSSYQYQTQKYFWYLTNGSANCGWGYTYGTGPYGDGARANWDFGLSGLTQVSWDNTNWY